MGKIPLLRTNPGYVDFLDIRYEQRILISWFKLILWIMNHFYTFFLRIQIHKISKFYFSPCFPFLPLYHFYYSIWQVLTHLYRKTLTYKPAMLREFTITWCKNAPFLLFILLLGNQKLNSKLSTFFIFIFIYLCIVYLPIFSFFSSFYFLFIISYLFYNLCFQIHLFNKFFNLFFTEINKWMYILWLQ